VIHVQPEDGHYQVPKHVVVLYVIIIYIYIYITLNHIVVLDSKFTPLQFVINTTVMTNLMITTPLDVFGPLLIRNELHT